MLFISKRILDFGEGQVKRILRVLANLDQIAVWIAQVATPFPAIIVERLSE
jgi:hypothetical protein